jgi:NADPH2:quinone reductase
MRAAFYETSGAAREVLRVGELPTPTPGPGEVRVRIAWSGVNPSDVKSRAMASGRPLAFPRIIPHSDGAGTIDAVGADVPASRVGERVWLFNGQWQRPFGTAAEYITLPAHQAVRLPNAVDLAVGACLGIPALTAYHAVMTDGGVANKRVLVAGGAGAVGHYALQLARLMGARQLLTTVSGPEKGEIARAAGADVVVNYRTEDAAARVHHATGGAGVDRVIEVDAAANIGLDVAIVAPEGDLVIYGSGQRDIPMPFGPLIMKNVGVRFFIVYNLRLDVQQRAITHLTSLLERGALTHNIAARLPLERIAEAHELVEQGRATGTVIVSPSHPG